MSRKIEINDALDRRLVLDRAPERLVSLVPSITETLFALGAGERLAAVSEYCTHPPEGVAEKEKVGGVKNPDIDKIANLSPDLVIVNREENHKEHVEKLVELGITVLVTYPRTVEEGLQMIRELARVTDTQEKAGELLPPLEESYRETLDMVRRRGSVNVFCPIWKDPYMSINGDTYIHDVLRCSGGDNVFKGKEERYPRVSMEEIEEAAPEVILLPDEPYRFTEPDLSDFMAHPRIPAVREGRIHLIDGKIIAWYGPRVGPGMVALRELLAPA
jgi:ABC-type Fe3+-hydroxamate transport system substrate-binding protein